MGKKSNIIRAHTDQHTFWVEVEATHEQYDEHEYSRNMMFTTIHFKAEKKADS